MPLKQTNKNAISTLSVKEGGIVSVCFGLQDSVVGKIGGLLFGKTAGCINLNYKDYNTAGTCRAKTTGFDLNAVLFDINGFGVTWLYLIAAIIVLFIIFGTGGRKWIKKELEH